MADHPLSPLKAFSQILILAGLCVLGLFLFSVLGIGFCSVVFHLGFSDIQALTSDPAQHSQSRMVLLIVQSFSAIGAFLIAPLLLPLLTRSPLTFQFPKVGISGLLIAGLVGVSLLMMPVNAWLAAWNESIRLPEFLSPIQDWAMEKEITLEKLTLFLINFQTPAETLFGFLVVAIAAGISEEFFFRKLIQPRAIALTGHVHVGIWLTAFVFAAIHVQFYGLIPRMILGAVFGYYYYWTGNIAYSMLGHILNNGITLLAAVLYQQKMSPIDVENPQQFPWYVGAVAAGITWSLLVIFKEEAEKRKGGFIQNEPSA